MLIRIVSRSSLSGVWVALSLACAAPAQPVDGLASACDESVTGPTLTLLDSVVLEESDSLYVGNPAVTFTVDAGGNLYIPDRGSNRLFQYDPDGRLVRVFGQPGSGPGEFRGIGYAGLVADGEIWINDYRHRRISQFSTSGAIRRDLRYSGRLSSFLRTDHGTWAGLADRINGLGLAFIPTGDTPDSLVATSVDLPEEYHTYPILANWDDIRIAGWMDSLVVAFGGVNYLAKFDNAGTAVDTAWVPACRRQGSPEAVLNAGFRRAPSNAQEQSEVEVIQTKISGLLGLWRLDDGYFVVWYQDPKLDSARIYTSVGFLSIVTPDFRQACVDAEIAAEGSSRAVLGMHRGQVWSLDQVLVDEPNVQPVRTLIRRYRLDRDRCVWLPTTRLPRGTS